MSPLPKSVTGTSAHPQSVRAYLHMLSERGAVRMVEAPTAIEYEIAAHLALTGAGPALVFENVTDHTLRVVGNLLPTRERIALGLSTSPDQLQKKLVDAICAPMPGRWLDEAPCQEIAIERPDLGTLPIPRFFEHETGPYLTASAIVAR